MRIAIPALLGLGTILLAGCGGSSSSSSSDDTGGNPSAAARVSIPFRAVVGNEPFECGRTYSGIGLNGGNNAVANDARLFIHNVRFITNDDREIPVTLDDQVAAHQKAGVGEEGIALLDLRDKSLGCTGEEANPDYYDTITGRADIANENIRALRFSVGVPEKYNHIDAQGGQPQVDADSGEPIPGSTATGPLIASGMGAGGMHWSWAMGYVHARLEMKLPEGSNVFFIHLGSTACEGEAVNGERTCANGNRPDVEVDGFDLRQHAVRMDLASLLSGNDITVNQGGPFGCMSSDVDQDCLPIFERLGLPFPGGDPDGDFAPVFSAVDAD
ncbi:MbnP family protein [Alloalcanivorax gelatiniphagus]|uniref:Metallo-mystery pair system four-Cys motif protein n=1 Tax=Alloalcanivorax gelatiniphagus TaxID=1194167 RepID=A0ABY2XM03_9GAMM|nr:MbnP family protein [Alloalcanivorax gelatiniphagus]TMW13296.1 metallo-mystery pair system four-Cys motif protein [Alloalcanivorax gelatiniphagus]|tara:strand:+ start:13442 stop:14428 length:987 start_codon:yes stop_codon:yes gene_type:complete